MAKDKEEKTEIAQPDPKGNEPAANAEQAPKPASSKRLVVIIAAAALLVIGGGAGWYFLRPHSDAAVADSSATSDSTAITDSAKDSASAPEPTHADSPDSSVTDPEVESTDIDMAGLMDEFNYELDTNAILQELGMAEAGAEATDSAHDRTSPAHAADGNAPTAADMLVAVDSPAVGIIPQHIMKLQAALAERELQIKKREQELDQREKQLADRELRMQQEASQKVAAMAKLYDGMEPAAAAKVLVNLEDDVVAGLIPRMKPKNAALVMALLPPVRAAEISRQIMAINEE